jgi:prophage regulatory protein
MERKLLRLRAVQDLVGLSRSEIYRRMALGLFPRSVPIGSRARAWLSDEIARWIEERKAARGAA